MKKLIATLITVTAGAAGFAAGFDWNTSSMIMRELQNNQTVLDSAVTARAQQFIDTAEPQNDSDKRRLLALRVMVRIQLPGADMSWQTQKKYVDDQIVAAKFEKTLATKDYLDLLYIWWYRGWDNEIYALMKTLPGYEQWGNAGHLCEKKELYAEAYDYYFASAVFPDRAVNIASTRLNDPVKAFSAAKLVLTRTYNAACVSTVVGRVVSGLVGNTAVSAADMKDFLQNVNRKYSAMLLKDKAAWEPVIAQVRTMLETY